MACPNRTEFDLTIPYLHYDFQNKVSLLYYSQPESHFIYINSSYVNLNDLL
jgi:hypothetical protein